MIAFKQSIFCFLFIFVLTEVSGQSFIGMKGQVNNFGSPLVIKRDLFSKTLGKTFNPGFGISYQFDFHKKWSIQAEINYQEQRKSYLLTGIETINTSILQYVRTPILFKYNFSFEQFDLATLIGPNPGYAFQLKSGETSLQLQHTTFEKLSFSEYDVKRFDLGLLLGIAVEKMVTDKFKTALSLRYNIGVLDIMNDDFSTFYNRGYTLEMAIYVPLSPVRNAKAPTKN